MDYTNKLKYWNNLFLNRKAMFPPENYLVENIDFLQGDTFLDLGCGDGRNTLYLAEKGFKVTAADFSETGLQKINALNKPEITTIQCDCNNVAELQQIGTFNSIILSHFIPDFDSLKFLPQLLRSKGTILMIAFHKKMRKQREDSKNLILGFDELHKAIPQMNYIKKEYFKDNRGYFNGCILQK